MNRYTSVRRFANETNLIVSTNFVKRYTFDEVDVSNVLQDLLKSGEKDDDDRSDMDQNSNDNSNQPEDKQEIE